MIKIVITARENLFRRRTTEEEVRFCKDIVDQIKRHIDDVGSIEIIDDDEDA